MIIASNIGDFECNSRDDFKAQMLVCMRQEQGNEIWCSLSNEDEFPTLSILTSQLGAVVNYFSEENEEQFASVGAMEEDGCEAFLNGQYEVAVYQIISLEKALECALEFYDTHERPECIEWEEI